MRSSLTFLLWLALLAGCNSLPQQGRFDALLAQPLSESQRIAVTEARDDFEAVVRYEKPIHAVPHQFGILDGGSMSYSGRGYRIMVFRQWSGVKGGEVVFLYGPEVTFDEKLFPRVHQPISSSAFYRAADILQKLKLPPSDEEKG